jgi:hypothetical protein
MRWKMPRLIDVEWALASASSGLVRTIDGEKWIRVSEVKESIRNAPTVDAFDINSITAEHEDIGYEKGRRDGYAEAVTDAERHGHWIERSKVYPDFPYDSTYNYECSNCGYMDTHGANVEVPYCWHCGAKMDEVEDEDS